jgi:hypothetical protein
MHHNAPTKLVQNLYNRYRPFLLEECMKTFSVRISEDLYNVLYTPGKKMSNTIRDILVASTSGHLYKGSYINMLLDDFPVYCYDVLWHVYGELFNIALLARREKDFLRLKDGIIQTEEFSANVDFSRAIPLESGWKFFDLYNATKALQFYQNKSEQYEMTEHLTPYLHFIVKKA